MRTLTGNIRRENLLLQLEKAVSKLLCSLYSSVEVVWLFFSKYVILCLLMFIIVLVADFTRSEHWFCSTLRTLFLNFYCLWMVRMLLPVKKWHQQCPVQKLLLTRGSSCALKHWWLRYLLNLFTSLFWFTLFTFCIIWILNHCKVDRLQSAEQKATDFRSSDDGIGPDHRPTNACTRCESSLIFHRILSSLEVWLASSVLKLWFLCQIPGLLLISPGCLRLLLQLLKVWTSRHSSQNW